MWRIPRIRRLEYILDFLNGIKQGLDEESLKLKLSERKYSFEFHKYKVIGRGNPFSEKLKISDSTINDCYNLATKLGLLEQNTNKLSFLGKRIIELKEDEQIHMLIQQFINSYTSVQIFLLTLNNNNNKEILLPLTTGNKNFKFFIDHARKLNLDFDPLSFYSVRDMLSQGGIINWLPFPYY